jgi:hypothetical protein
MSHPERSTAAVLAVLRPPVVDGGGGRSGPQAPAGTARQASEKEHTRWVKGRAGPAPLRSGSRPRRIPPRVASRQPGLRPGRQHPRRAARPPGSGPRISTSGRQTPGSGRRRVRVGTRNTASRGTAVRGTGTRETGSRHRPAGYRKMDARETGGQGADGQGTGSRRMPDTSPKSGGGRGTTGGGSIRDQPVLIRCWRAAKRCCRPPGVSAWKPFAQGVPITQRIHRSPARRQAQTRGLLGILAQNGARKG